MIKAIIFDFDGVLVESTQIKTSAFKEIFRSEGPVVEDAVAAYHEANPGVPRLDKFRKIYCEILRRPVAESELLKLCDRFKSLVFEKVKEAPYVAGVEEFIRNNKNKYSFYVASAAPQAEITEIIYARGMAVWFDSVYGFPVLKSEAIRKILAGAVLKQKEVIFVGDALTDMTAAVSAGLYFVARIVNGGADFKEFHFPKIKDLTALEGVISRDFL